MKISRAQKEISRLKGEIKELKHRMEKSLNIIEGNNFPEDFPSLWSIFNTRVIRLITLKNAVMEANIKRGKFLSILKLGELKNYLEFVRELKPIEGIVVERYGEGTQKYISQSSIKSKQQAIEIIQKQINSITDELDDFNAITDIGDLDVTVQSLPEINNKS